MAMTRKANFEGSYNKLLQIDKAAKEFKRATGKRCDQVMLARTLYATTGDETSGKIDKEEKLNVEGPGPILPRRIGSARNGKSEPGGPWCAGTRRATR